MELNKLLCVAFDADFPVTLTFDYPTVNALSRFIAAAAKPDNLRASAAHPAERAQMQQTPPNVQPAPPSSNIVAIVKRLVVEVLGREDRIDDGIPLVEAGIDSFSEAAGFAGWMTTAGPS